MAKILDLSGLPDDAMERLVWLNGVLDAVKAQLDPVWAAAYYEARLSGRLDEAEALGFHSHKRVMAWTRQHNEATGRLIRWGDKRG